MISFREYLIECEINDFYTDIKSYQDFYNKEQTKLNNRFPLVLPIVEAVILPENLKINSDLSDIDSLNKEFKKLKVFFELNQDDNPKHLDAYYNQAEDKICVFHSTRNTKLEVEAIVGHEMIHREQHKRSNGNYFERAKKLTAEINNIVKEYERTKNPDLIKDYQKKLKFKNFDDSYEQMAYVYQTIKENPDLTPNQLVKYFTKFGFNIDFKLKKYIGMYWLIKDKIKD